MSAPMSPATELISPAKAVMIAAVFEVPSLGRGAASGGGGAVVRSASDELVDVSFGGSSEEVGRGLGAGGLGLVGRAGPPDGGAVADGWIPAGGGLATWDKGTDKLNIMSPPRNRPTPVVSHFLGWRTRPCSTCEPMGMKITLPCLFL